jgi:hypothetical protein
MKNDGISEHEESTCVIVPAFFELVDHSQTQISKTAFCFQSILVTNYYP